jgi:hypothetical protein
MEAEELVMNAITFLRFFLLISFFVVEMLLSLLYFPNWGFFRHLKTLTMSKGQLGDTFFQALAECPLLNTLTVSDASLGSGIQEVTVNHDVLRELQIVKCRALRISIR